MSAIELGEALPFPSWCWTFWWQQFLSGASVALALLLVAVAKRLWPVFSVAGAVYAIGATVLQLWSDGLAMVEHYGSSSGVVALLGNSLWW